MSDDYGYLMQDTDKSVLNNLSKMGEHLKELKKKLITAESAYEMAKKELEHYESNVLPSAMHSAGIDSLSLASGGKMSVKRNYYCQPNKNDADRAIMVEWLKEHGGGHLVKDSAIVSGVSVKDLKAAKIPFAEKQEINTSSLKAFLKDLLGLKNGTAQITIDDIPKCMHFQEVVSIELEV